MNVTLLGTGGPLSPDRCTMGMMVTAPGCSPLVIDTCGGFEFPRQLSRAGFKMSDVTNVIVTHRHLDHAGGLQALYLASRPIVLHALRDTIEGTEQVKDGCFPEWGIDNPQWGHQRERFQKEVIGGTRMEIGGFEVEFFEMVHRVPTVAVRVSHDGRTMTFSADSRPCEQLVAAARNADLFLCDALYPERQGEQWAAQARRLMHPTAKEAGEMARAAGVKALACVHSASSSQPELILAEAAESFGGPTSLPSDLARLKV